MSELAIISVEKELDPIREKNLFLTIVISNYIWMIFHFTVVFFFTFQLKSLSMVGIFLGIWNVFSILFDISIWIIQKYFKPKTIFIASFILQILTMLIFVYFTLWVWKYIEKTLIPDGMWIISDWLALFLWDWINILLLIIATLFYGVSKEMQEVTLVSYILNNANHSQYIGLIAKKNLWTWIWAFVWLVLSWFILMLSPNFIIILTVLILISTIYFTKAFFDTKDKTLDLNEIKKFLVFLDKSDKNNLWINQKNKVEKIVNKDELKNIIDAWKYLFLKPAPVKSWLSIKMLMEETKKEFIMTYKIFMNSSNSLMIYWCIIMLITFGFWDTFASTFLIKFLDNLWNGMWYILLWFIAIPAFWLQKYFSSLSKRYWIYNISNLWLVISGISLFFMWIFSESTNVFLIVFLAVLNSVWYAACMTLSQAWFLEFYNKAFAEYNNLKEIDSNASSAPFKMISNLSSVIWFLLGWILLSTFHYIWAFILLWLTMIYILFWTRKYWINRDYE